MRKVVDRNYLQSPKLRNYLAESRRNRVVLADYAAMEAFKGDALINIVTATEILREFPKQVIVLKSTNVIAGLKGRRCGFTRRMIDRDQTTGFPEWCEHTARAAAGDKDLQRQIAENGKEADAHLNWHTVRDTEFAYPCLDPLEVLKAHQSGVENAVAALGAIDATFLQVLSRWMEERRIASIVPM